MTEHTYRVGFDSRTAESRARGFRKELELTERSTEKLDRQTRVLGGSFRLLGGALAGFAGISGFGKIVRDVSELEQINARIGNLTGNLADEQQFLKSTARELSTEYVSLANSYSKLLPLQQAGLLTTQQSRELTKGLANVQATAGASSVQLGQSIFGLSQGLASGNLKMEELNQVTEPLPGLLNALDRASGTAAGGFRKMVLAGEVTSELFRDTLLVALKDYEGNAAALGGNIQQSFARVQNEYTNLIDALEEPVNNALVPFAESLESILANVAENADDYIGVITAVGAATAAAFGARVIGELSSYGLQQGRNVQTALQAARANQALAATNAQEAASKVRQAKATAEYSAIKLRETQQQALSIAGFKRLTFVQTELAAAEKAAALATANVTAAQTAATASANTLAAAQARVSVSARAMAASMGLARGALALVGGPVGAAALATFGVYKFVDSLDDMDEKTAESIDTVDRIAESYKHTGDAAQEAAEKTITLAEAQLRAARSSLEARASGPRAAGFLGGVFDFFDERELAELERSIDEARQRVTDSAKEFGIAAREQAIGAALGRASTASVESAGDQLIAGLFPSDAKISALETQRIKLDRLLSRGGISTDEFKRANTEIDAQIKRLKESSRSYRANKQAIDERNSALSDYQDIVSDFNPNFEAQFEYEENVKRLDEAQKKGAISAVEYESTLADLDQRLERDFIDIRIEKERELRDLMSQDVDFSSVDSYADSMRLLNRALEDTPEKAQQIQQAIARLNTDFIGGQFSGDDDSTGTDDIQRQFDERARVIQEYRAVEGANVKAANQELLIIEQQRFGALQALEQQENSRRLEGISAYTQDIISEGEAASEAKLRAAINSGASVERAEADHQARLAAIREFQFELEVLKDQYRQGLITLQEYHAAVLAAEKKFAGDLADNDEANFQDRYSREIGFANQLFDLGEQRLARKAAQALTEAQQARKIADNATGAEKAALEEQAILAEQYARKRFNDEKKASIAQARVQQALAVVKAWTSGSTIYDQILNAGIAFAGTESVIQDLKAQQFNGGSPIGGGGTGASSGASGNSGGNFVNGQDIGTGNAGPTVINVVTADELIDEQKLKDKYAGITAQMIDSGELQGATLNTLN